MDDDGCTMLYAAIYREAARDDLRTVKGKIAHELDKRKWEQNKIRDYINKNSEAIRDMVNRAVYEEAQNWGHGPTTRGMQKIAIDSIVAYMVKEAEE